MRGGRVRLREGGRVARSSARTCFSRRLGFDRVHSRDRRRSRLRPPQLQLQALQAPTESAASRLAPPSVAACLAREPAPPAHPRCPTFGPPRLPLTSACDLRSPSPAPADSSARPPRHSRRRRHGRQTQGRPLSRYASERIRPCGARGRCAPPNDPPSRWRRGARRLARRVVLRRAGGSRSREVKVSERMSSVGGGGGAREGGGGRAGSRSPFGVCRRCPTRAPPACPLAAFCRRL